MDTKWKKSKKIISFIIFFLGVTLTLDGITGILRYKPFNVPVWQVETLLEEDYQQSERFRQYIANRLENFLIMATGGDGLGGIWGYDNGRYYGGGYDGGYYYGDYYSDYYDYYNYYGYPDYGYPEDDGSDSSGLTGVTDRGLSLSEQDYYLEAMQELEDAYSETLKMIRESGSLTSEELEAYEDTLDYYQDTIDEYQRLLDKQQDDRPIQNIKPLSEEQKKKLAQKFHDSIKGDLNLLYTIVYEDKVLYSNSDLLGADGSPDTPEGYNFLLYFDGEKVRIVKDGKEVDVYGDGYYRDDSLWYVPGYRNFQTDESLRKAKVCIAAAKEPLLYKEGSYGNGTVRQSENALYWMHQNLSSRRDLLIARFISLAAGLALLLLSFLCRKSRRQAAEDIARLQAKIWAEFKAMLILALLCLLYLMVCVWNFDGSGFTLWEELAEVYTYDYSGIFDIVFYLGCILLGTISSPFWILLFWGIYLLCNDLRHNRKFWRHSLILKLYKIFTYKGLERPLPRKMARRNAFSFILTLLFGILVLAAVILQATASRHEYPDLLPLALLALTGSVATEYLTGKKNMETARDLETLSRRIGEIRDGNYKKDNTYTQPSCHDLETAMSQLEDIRHGMAKAVDEQMRSQRMKVELIANVSHDIKTPLTSIISYVEFLKQEEGLPEHVKDYVKILDEKSQRLKNMVQDVFAVSKAASGELPMHMEELDFGKLLRQTLADMGEQIDSSAVTFRTEIPESPVMIRADGQRMYRVFQNLFQNAIQYSLDGSRVYVTLMIKGNSAVASVKNTSHLEPEKDKDFTERFTRGDQSRTDGGSGLGLSIAQSFTEACGGEFSLEIDADRFIVSISFGII